MADEDTEAEAESTVETTAEQEVEAEATDDVTIDVEAIDEYERRIEELSTAVEEREDTIEELQSVVEAQSEQIDKLENQFLDLSARVADGRNLGVCPECNGPTEKKERLFRSDTIECTRCGEVIHTY
ncbi:SlyX family protein [Halorubrum sp. 2020YC2]|uniref:SlyX family protein n=1 Tax=Halorubrum sp. 2020YC2 TaxID=2836432 RepID=UPI001BEA6744|nr:SlyX family protein [Halorubrum sp. 2020YC2]QWC19707.1 SlyX family protein [Halorubrum sp. 2020YC2]